MKNIQAIFLPIVLAGVATILTLGVASADSVYVSNSGDDTISIITSGGTTAFGSSSDLDSPTGLAFDPINGNLFVANSGSGDIAEFTPNGALVTSSFATGVSNAQGLAFDSAGNLFVASKSTGNIYEFPTVGPESIFATDTVGINGLAFDKAGNLFVTTGDGDQITVITPSAFSANLTVTGKNLNGPDGIAFDSAGNIYVVNHYDPSVEKIVSGGSGSVFINSSTLTAPRGIAIDSDGNIFVANDCANTVTEYTAGGLVNTYTSTISDPSFITTLATDTLPVPEPSTYALLTASLGYLFFMNRRKNSERLVRQRL
jgi:sugar lactone lactonase YvrE